MALPYSGGKVGTACVVTVGCGWMQCLRQGIAAELDATNFGWGKLLGLDGIFH
jgi:hypothetical protein